MDVLCSVCAYDFAHIITTLEVKNTESKDNMTVIVDGKHHFHSNKYYGFRSQGNLHILFQGECGHFFIHSYDGHKGNIFLNENSLMDNLTAYLNKKYKMGKLNYDVHYELLGHIERFLMTDRHVGEE